MSIRAGDGWNIPGPAGNVLITRSNESVVDINKTGTMMFIYAGYEGNGDILFSAIEMGEWTKPESVHVSINTSARETSFAISDDGNEIFFTSDRKRNSVGGRDIYFMKRIRKNKWSKPENLGELINTPGNEESVAVSASGDTLWFSSNGREGFGGFDTYYCVKDTSGNWLEPVNPGAPLNSPGNDMFYKPSPFNPGEAWIASDRAGGNGGLDIYKVLYKQLNQ